MADFVTRDEFTVVYDIVKETRNDVKILLAAKAADDAVEGERTKHADRKAVWKPTMIATVVSSLTYIALHFF